MDPFYPDVPYTVVAIYMPRFMNFSKYEIFSVQIMDDIFKITINLIPSVRE